MRQIAVQVRPLTQEEVGLLEQRLDSDPSEKHRQRLALQQQGLVLYLAAWKGQEPVGHLLLKWDGTEDEPMASRLADCPDIEDLWVRPDLRSGGIGSRLLAAAEDLARQRGYPRVGLGVGIDNLRALALYQRRGYQDSGFGEYPHAVYYLDEQGQHRVRWEICVYLTKRLS
ncbi:MAG: GNAT family N-acetyltransferase [Chloroflexota bacterium]